jgi:hypothetical protein
MTSARPSLFPLSQLLFPGDSPNGIKMGVVRGIFFQLQNHYVRNDVIINQMRVDGIASCCTSYSPVYFVLIRNKWGTADDALHIHQEQQQERSFDHATIFLEKWNKVLFFIFFFPSKNDGDRWSGSIARLKDLSFTPPILPRALLCVSSQIRAN